MNVHLNGAGAARKPRSAAMIYFYTQCRNWHGYLSAFAFLVLMFFSATGLLLNHPDWLTAGEPEPETATIQIETAKIEAARKSQDPGAILGSLVASRVKLLGVYASGDVDDSEAMLRFEGAKGTSTVMIDMRSGEAKVQMQTLDPVTVLNELHRGKNVGATWKAVIDISAILILILSVIGYVLFFSMRFRFRTAMMLTAVSVVLLCGIFIWLVP